MADDSKISLLPDADALDGAEISPLVQAGATKKTLFSTIRTWLANTFVSGPASSTDNAIVRFDGTGGKTVQNSVVTIADTTGEISGGGLLKSTVSNGASAVGYVLDTTNALSTLGAKLLSLKNSGTEKFSVDKDGALVSGVLYSKVDGTLYLEGITGQTTGNARGAGAIDLQTSRDGASKVASGANAVALGYRNTASGSQSFCVGSANVASGLRSASIGGVIATASGADSFSTGTTVTASGNGAFSCGSGSISANASQFSVGGCGYNGSGVGQSVIQPMCTTTTDATATVLNIGLSAINRPVIAAKRLWVIIGTVAAISNSTDGYKTKGWEIKAILTRDNSNSTRIVGTPTITVLGNDADAAGWSVDSITADDTNESLAINVTGEAATTIKWAVTLLYTQSGH